MGPTFEFVFLGNNPERVLALVDDYTRQSDEGRVLAAPYCNNIRRWGKRTRLNALVTIEP